MSRNERYIAFTRALDDLYIYSDILDITGFEKKTRNKKDEELTEAQDKEQTGRVQEFGVIDKGKDMPKHRAEKSEKNHADSEVKRFFVSNGLDVVDNRDRGGRLWVVGEKVAIRNIVSAAIAKFVISGKYASGKEIKNKNGWCTKTDK